MNPPNPRQGLHSDNDLPPVRLLRHILSRRSWHPGARVLLVGFDCGQLIPLLDELACGVGTFDGAADRWQRPLAGRQTADHHSCLTFDVLSAQSREPLPVCEYDLLLVNQWQADQENLVSSAARLGSARLLAALKPCGEFSLVRALDAAGLDCDGHTPQCWEQHLACFAGTRQWAVWEPGWLSPQRWSWWQRQRPPAAHLLTTFQTPMEYIPAEQWQQAVRRSLLTDRQLCTCPPRSQNQQSSHTRQLAIDPRSATVVTRRVA